MAEHMPRILAIDAGGTMTDTFVVDEAGMFTIGKAQTTPNRESDGLLRSFDDALHYWDMERGTVTQHLMATVYSGTSMLNRLLERRGDGPIGVLVTAGMEDYFRMERAAQTYAGYPFSDRLHVVTHVHNEPLVPRKYIKGIRERISFFGEEVVPLYQEEVRDAVKALGRQGVKALCVSFLYSYRDPRHELAALEIAQQVLAEEGIDIPVYLSSRSNPVRGDLARLNTLVVEVYAARPSRLQLFDIRDRLRAEGSSAPVRVLASYGGTVSPDVEWLVTTLISGPIGGILGARRLSEVYHFENVVCTDVGGTSFDVGLITERELLTRTEPTVARFLLTLPTLAMDSIGAGTGTLVRIDPAVRRVTLGPDSAGYRLGVCNADSGITVPSITDCDLALGYINPEYFLGGEVKVDRERALAAIEEQIAQPLSSDPFSAAEGVVRLLETQMRDHLYGMVLGLGYAPENYRLFGYGGGGPLHVAGYTEGLAFQDILVPTWAAAFSAFGGACADYAYRYDRSIDLLITPETSAREMVAQSLNQAWEDIRNRIGQEFQRDGLNPAEMSFVPSVRMQYLGMLDDIEVRAKWPIDAKDGLTSLIDRFDELFAKIFARSARSPEAGYFVTKAIGVGILPTEKPVLPKFPLQGATPSINAHKGTRKLFWRGEWHTAQLWEMDRLHSGNEILGPSVIEAPATTFLVPPGRKAVLDAYRVFHLNNG
ncbi:MAG: acetone carboxylase subunit beta [Sulfobacillus benefaciens]|uniref:Acetone carboxylase subunit beta n=1 Tax=Sulfobacillus benefaciens TaxID=453960 RepID=A0A2T2X8N8_9FIRM|nr:MAG: acetone carboxylase subunit beta [Sulfobacillus benefaciens]